MSKRFSIILLSSLWLLARPSLVMGDVSSVEIQREMVQLQADVVQHYQQHADLEEQELKKAQIDVSQEQPPPAENGPSFRVNEIELIGNTIFSDQQLSQYINKYQGRTLDLKDLQDLAMMITAFYQSAGYVTCHAFVPPQRILDGRVVIRVVEGRVGQISIAGNRWFSDKLYFDRLYIGRGQFFDMQQLAMSLQDMNQLPDRFVKAYIQPGQDMGTSDIILKAQDQHTFHASYEYNNQGTPLTHLTRNILHLTDNNLTGHGDSLQLNMTMAEQSSVLGAMVQYVLPDPKNGLTYSLNEGYDYSRLEGYLRSSKVTSRSYDIFPGITKNYVKGQRIKIDGFLGFEVKDSKTLVQKGKLFDDRSRVVDMGPRVSIDDSWGKTLISGDMRGGIPAFLDGSLLHDPEASRIKSGGEFIYWTSSVDRINRLPFGMYLVIHGGAQYSPTPLTSLEQFYVGGLNSVRGYPESDSSGDSGVNFSTELRIPPYFIPSGWHVFNSKDKTWRDSLSIVTFVDGGRVFNYYRQVFDGTKDRSLLSMGVGLKYYLNPDMNCQAGIGFPMGDAPSSGSKHDQMYLSARVGF